MAEPISMIALGSLAAGLSIPPLIASLQAVTKVLGEVKDQINKTLDTSNKLEKMSLALGKTFTDTEKSLRPVMQGLRGTIEQKFVGSIAGMQQGLQGNTAGIARLINQQQLTGLSFGKTGQVMAKLETTLGLSRDSTNYLSNSLIATSREWNTSTEHLVEVIDSLSRTFPAQQLAGLGEGLVGAVTELGAELPSNIARNFDSVITAIFDTSEDAYANLVRLGIGNIREQLAAVEHSTELSRGLLVEAIKTASRTTEFMAGGANKFYRQVGIAQEALGKTALDFNVVARNLGTRVRVEGQQALDFGKTLENLKNEVLQPLLTYFLQDLYPELLKMVDFLSFAGQHVAKVLSEMLGEQIGETSSAFRTLTIGILKTSIYGINILEGLWKNYGETGLKILSVIVYITDLIIESIAFTHNTKAMAWELIQGIVLSIGWGIGKILNKFGLMGDDTLNYLTGLLDKSASKFFESVGKAFNNVKDMLTNPVDQWGAIQEKINASANDSNNGLGNKLLGPILKAFQEGKTFQRESNEYLDSMKDGIASIDRKTPEPVTNNLLNENVNEVSLMLERVLGIRTSDSYDAILEELRKQREAAEQTKDAAVKTSQIMSNVETNTFLANNYLANPRSLEKPA